MTDPVSTLIERIASSLNQLQRSDGQVVASGSVLVGGPKAQMLPMAQRLSPTAERARAREAVEQSALGQGTNAEDDALEQEMIQTLADDAIHKILEDMFGE
jgi:hypothetical protein